MVKAWGQIVLNSSCHVIDKDIDNNLKWYQTKKKIYRKISNISLTLVGNKDVDHSDAVVASPVGAAPTTSSFST